MFRRLAQDEQGVALVLALISMLVLSSLSASVLLSSAVNHRSSYNSANATHAFALAEEGLADAEGVLYTKVTGGCTSNCVPTSSFTQDGGTVSYSGTLSGSTWTMTGTGTINGTSRKVSAQATVGASQTIPDPSIWNYLYTDNKNSCFTLQGGSTVAVPLYTQGPVCITGGAHFTGSDLEVGGSLTIGGGSNIGTSSSKIAKLEIAGTCSQLNTGLPNPGCAGNGPLIYASTVGNTVSPVLTMPTVDLAGTYATQKASTQTGCPAGLLDNDGTLNNSVASVNLFPTNSSYDCKVGTNEIKWNATGSWTQGTLLVNGEFYFDGSLSLGGGMHVTYTGGGTLYFTGTVTIQGGTSICGGVGGNPSGCGGWTPASWNDPTKTATCAANGGCNVLTFVAGCWANSTGSSLVTSACGHVTGGATFEAGELVKTNFTLDGGSIDQGPVIADTISVAGGTSILQKMPFYYLPAGTPTDTTSVPSLPSAPTNWSG